MNGNKHVHVGEAAGMHHTYRSSFTKTKQNSTISVSWLVSDWLPYIPQHFLFICTPFPHSPLPMLRFDFFFCFLVVRYMFSSFHYFFTVFPLSLSHSLRRMHSVCSRPMHLIIISFRLVVRWGAAFDDALSNSSPNRRSSHGCHSVD